MKLKNGYLFVHIIMHQLMYCKYEYLQYTVSTPDRLPEIPGTEPTARWIACLI